MRRDAADRDRSSWSPRSARSSRGSRSVDARRSRKAAEQSLRIAQEQHAAFLGERFARADFDVEVSVEYPPPERHALRAASGSQAVRVRFRVTNVGTRTADPAMMNLLYPESTSGARWTSQDGRRAGGTPPPLPSDESLQVAGKPISTRLVYRALGRLSPEDVFIGFFQVHVPLTEGWSDVDVPFSARVWAEDMPPGIEDRRDDVVITLRHDPSAPG